jgi:hypothetical protein
VTARGPTLREIRHSLSFRGHPPLTDEEFHAFMHEARSRGWGGCYIRTVWLRGTKLFLTLVTRGPRPTTDDLRSAYERLTAALGTGGTA